jgi:CRP/FNR family transcriptional regulator, transcriptional activator FtrB
MFAPLSQPSLVRLSAIATLADIDDGVTLCREGDRADKFHVLLCGMVTLSAEAANGRSAVVEVIRPVRHLVLATVLAGLPYAVTAVTITPATLLVIGAADLQALLRDDPALGSVLMRVQALDFRAMVREVCDLKLRTAAERLGCYLLELSQEQQGRNSSQLRLPIGKQLLAARIGCRHENLSRAFASLRAFGVETHGKRVILHDVQRLREFALPTSVATPKPS